MELFFAGIFSSWGVGVQALIGLRWLRELPFSVFLVDVASIRLRFWRNSYFLSFLKSLLLSILRLICFIFLLASLRVSSGISLSWSVFKVFLSMLLLEVALDLCPLCLPSILGTNSLSTRD